MILSPNRRKYMKNINLYEIYTKSNGKYYSTYPASDGDVSELKILSYDKIIINDEDDFKKLTRTDLLKYYPDGDTFEEWSYYEPKNITIIQGCEKHYEYEEIVEDTLITQVIERFYDYDNFNIGYFLKLPYTLYFVKIFERV